MVPGFLLSSGHCCIGDRNGQPSGTLISPLERDFAPDHADARVVPIDTV